MYLSVSLVVFNVGIRTAVLMPTLKTTRLTDKYIEH